MEIFMVNNSLETYYTYWSLQRVITKIKVDIVEFAALSYKGRLFTYLIHVGRKNTL